MTQDSGEHNENLDPMNPAEDHQEDAAEQPIEESEFDRAEQDDRGEQEGGYENDREGGFEADREGGFEGGRGGGRRRRGRDRDRGGERRERIDSFEKMKVWQEAHQLTLKVFAATPKLPEEQQAGLAVQIEQAAVSVPRSIAEGFKRRGPRNKAHFYNMSQTALEALRYYFILCRDLGFDIDYEDLSYRAEQVSRMLDGLVRSMTR